VSAVPASRQPPPGRPADADWARIEATAPEVARVMRRYLRQLGTFLSPASVEAADNALRQLSRWMVTEAGLAAVGDVRRDHVEDFKIWLAARPRGAGRVITAETHRQRMRTIRAFFERIIEWDWPDVPPRNPVIAGDIPKKPEPLPKFPGDRDAAKLMAAARAAADPRDRLVMELLARTGMRAGELAGPEADAVVLIGGAHWLRIPLGKLHNDRYVPLHPDLVRLLTCSNTRRRVAPAGRAPAAVARNRWEGTGLRGRDLPDRDQDWGESRLHAYPHRFRHHFSHTWLDRGGEGGDLMELNGWSTPADAGRRRGPARVRASSPPRTCSSVPSPAAPILKALPLRVDC
jgi:site-specific recombinase XerD